MNQKDSTKNLHSPFINRAYDISVNVDNSGDLPIRERWRSTSNVSELSRKVFLSLFSLVASECLKDNYVDNIKDEFGSIVDLLFRRFNLDSLDEKGSLKVSVEEYITQLEKYLFFLPNDLVELAQDKGNLKSLEFDIGYEGDLDSVMKTIRDALISLREEKIQFWQEVLKTYKKDKEGYDLEFRTKQTRRKKDLNKISKIDIDDYIRRFDKK